jgi:ornithine carbamoyltransferase
MSNLLAIDDLGDDFAKILRWAITYKDDDEIAPESQPLDGKSVGCIYEKPSTRTRVSFEVGINRLGGHSLTLLSGDIQLGQSETIGDTAQVLSRFLDGITYRCYAHADVVELADKATVPVINALSDLHHPCQAAADMMTIMEHSDKLEGIKVAWVGDGNNVLHDLMLACAMLGVDCHWAVPPGHEPNSKVEKRAQRIAAETGAELVQTHTPVEAATDANFIYTDAFVSMGEEHLETKLADFDGFQVNLKLLEHADQDWKFMHCLPAHRGEEVTDEVIDHEQSIVFDQAENRMWAQMSILTYLLEKNSWDVYSDIMEV